MLSDKKSINISYSEGTCKVNIWTVKKIYLRDNVEYCAIAEKITYPNDGIAINEYYLLYITSEDSNMIEYKSFNGAHYGTWKFLRKI